MKETKSGKKVYIDEGLFERIHSGDKDAFRDLYEASYRSLYAFLLSLTQNAQDAQDLMQDTYVRIYQKSHLYQPNGNPMGWIMTIGKNLFLMEYRKKKHVEFASYDELEIKLGLDQIQEVENRMLLETMFSVLSAQEREIVILHDVGGMKFREISKMTDLAMGTVLARYNRSIKKMQREFGKR